MTPDVETEEIIFFQDGINFPIGGQTKRHSFDQETEKASKKYALASSERTSSAAEKEQARKELRSLLRRSLFSSLRIHTITCCMYVCTFVYLKVGGNPLVYKYDSCRK